MLDQKNQKSQYDKEEIENNTQSTILELLKVKPVLYEVCRWEIDPVTHKPVKKCWITEPVNAPVGK